MILLLFLLSHYNAKFTLLKFIVYSCCDYEVSGRISSESPYKSKKYLFKPTNIVRDYIP